MVTIVKPETEKRMKYVKYVTIDIYTVFKVFWFSPAENIIKKYIN